MTLMADLIVVDDDDNTHKKTVAFGCVHVHSHERILGDNPAVRYVETSARFVEVHDWYILTHTTSHSHLSQRWSSSDTLLERIL